jgi:hypothetical protein
VKKNKLKRYARARTHIRTPTLTSVRCSCWTERDAVEEVDAEAEPEANDEEADADPEIELILADLDAAEGAEVRACEAGAAEDCQK